MFEGLIGNFDNEIDELGRRIFEGLERFIDIKAEEITDLVSKCMEEIKDELDKILEKLTEKYPEEDEEILIDLIKEKYSDVVSNIFYSSADLDFSQNIRYNLDWEKN